MKQTRMSNEQIIKITLSAVKGPKNNAMMT